MVAAKLVQDTQPETQEKERRDTQPNSQMPIGPPAPLKHQMSISSLDVDMTDLDPSTVLDSPVHLTKATEAPSRQSVSRKSSVRADVQPQPLHADTNASDTGAKTPVHVSDPNTPKPTPAAMPSVDSSRRATRISSGALLKKSVSEILGETPRPQSPNNEVTTTPAQRPSDRDRKDKERSKLSTVVFAKPQKSSADGEAVEMSGPHRDEANSSSNHTDRDYMYTLFEQKANSQHRQGALNYLLQNAHKTVLTSDHIIDYCYQSDCRTLKRIYQLQNADKWGLRQRKRADEPPRQTSHWDFLLDHAKWMRTDFREERRWKMAAARAFAEDCAEWCAASAEERKRLQIHVKPRAVDNADTSGDDEMVDALEHPVSSPPELEEHGDEESVEGDLADPREVLNTIAPAAIFSLGASEFNFPAERTPALEKLLDELPLYEPSRIEPDLARSNLAAKLDAQWRSEISAVSRFVTEKIRIHDQEPPRKRSRYDYETDDAPSASHRQVLEPREKEVALFTSENKHIRDRIHPGHSFRPPAEHPMPTQSFFETRMSSQWLAADDDEVRKYAREYSFNWLLISDLLTPPTLYTSSPDRRSAWECFERWIGLEGMPADMSKTPYFKTYSSRIENAQRIVQAQWEEVERRSGITSVSTRKKTTLPVRVERKHNRRHLFMLDAMRKLAKKREAQRQKAQHSADLAATRRTIDVHAPRPGIKTPAEWSQIKFEREQKMAKQQEMYKQQLLARQRASVQQQRGGGLVNGVPLPPGAIPMRMPMPNGPLPAIPNGHLQGPNGQVRAHPNMMGLPQGLNLAANMMGPKNMPQQALGMARGLGGSPQQIKMQQEQLLRQAQQNGAHSSPNVSQASIANVQNVNSTAAYMNALSQASGQGSPLAGASSVSPRPGSSHIPQSLSSGSVPKITQLYASIKERFPALSDEEVQRMATQQLFSWQQQATAAAAGNNSNKQRVANQAAYNAAMGAANAASAANLTGPNGGGATSNPGMSYEQVKAYNERMRLQQAQQHAARGMQAPMASSVGGGTMMHSPVMTMARPTSQHGQVLTPGGSMRAATPREQRSGSVNGIGSNAPGQAGLPGAQQQQNNNNNHNGPHSSPRPPTAGVTTPVPT